MQSMAARREEKDSRRPTILSMQESRKLPLPKPKAGPRAWAAQPPREKQTFLQRARKQVAAEGKRFKLSTPTGKLLVAAGQITKAPEAMLNEARIELQSGPKAIRVLAPHGMGSSVTNEREREIERRRKENEARLLRVKNEALNKAAAGPNLVTFSDEEDGDFDDGPEHSKDMFGDSESNDSPNGGALSPPSHEGKATSLSRSAPKKPTKAPRRGLLSASPGASATIQRVAAIPTASSDSRPPSKVPASSPPPSVSAKPAAPHRATTLPTNPPNPAGPSIPPVPIQLKRKQVDVFMRPNKKTRR